MIHNNFISPIQTIFIILAWILNLRHKLQSYDKDERWTAMRKNSKYECQAIFIASILTVNLIVTLRGREMRRNL